jgi:hypothetical protein
MTSRYAYSKVLAPSVPASLLGLMHENCREAAASSYLANLREVMRDCHDTDWTDRKDFFYLHARVARFIMALGYHRGQALEQRRPFLTRGVLDVVQRLPAQFRVYKNLYLTMLQRYWPKAARAPYPSVNSLIDWNYELRMNAIAQGLFPADPSRSAHRVRLVGRFDRPWSIRALRDAFFAQRPRAAFQTQSRVRNHQVSRQAAVSAAADLQACRSLGKFAS